MPAPEQRPATTRISSTAPRGAGADEHRHALARVEDVGGALQVGSRGTTRGGLLARARVHGVVRVRRRLDGAQLLHVLGDDDARRRALAEAMRKARSTRKRI